MSVGIVSDSRRGFLVECSRKDVEISEVKKTLSARPRGLSWFHRAPRIRLRQPENKCKDQVLELAVLNERLAGAPPWEVRRKVEYLKKRQMNWDLVYDIIVRREAAATLNLIEEASNKIEEALSEETKESKSIIELKRDLITLQQEVNEAHEKLHSTEMRVRNNLHRIKQLKAAAETLDAGCKEGTPTKIDNVERSVLDYWYPVAFSKDLNSENTLLAFELFDCPWVLFRDEVGSPGCILDECAHRACPLSIGKVSSGRVACPYHGWEYNSKGECMKMPSTVFRKNVSISNLPATEQDGLIWVWPGSSNHQKMGEIPSFGSTPDEFTVVSEIEMTGQLSQGLILESLLDSHTPQVLTSWLKSEGLSTPQRDLTDESIIDLSFEPPCNVLTLSGMTNSSASSGKGKNFHQLHICLPSSKDHVRILQRTSINFFKWIHHIPPFNTIFESIAEQALEEDLELAKAQYERMMKYGTHKTNQ